VGERLQGGERRQTRMEFGAVRWKTPATVKEGGRAAATDGVGPGVSAYVWRQVVRVDRGPIMVRSSLRE